MTAKTTVDSFGQAILDLIVAASEGEVRLEMPSRAKATRLRQQIYQCRAAMRREGHYLLSKAEEVIVPAPEEEEAMLRLPGEQPKTVWTLTPQPQALHEDFLREALNKAGVKSIAERAEEEATRVPVDQPPLAIDPPTTSADSIGDYLKGN